MEPYWQVKRQLGDNKGGEKLSVSAGIDTAGGTLLRGRWRRESLMIVGSTS